MRRVRRALGAIAVVMALAACGSSGGGAQSAAPVIRAADVTAKASGYRIAGSGTMSGGPTGTIRMSMSGVFDRRKRLGKITTVVQTAGQRVSVPEIASRFTIYMSTSALPNLGSLTGGKPWVKLNMARAMGAGGLSSMPTATDPTQFVDYLRAVSASTTKVGTDTVRGVQTTHYRAVVDLDRYPQLVPPAQRPAVASSLKNLKAALGGHTMPLDVWIDGSHLVRRVGIHFGECVSGARFQFNMNVDLFDYGTEPRVTIPPANQTYDLTPLVQSSLRRAHYGCT
jgi:hypothetical protein